MIEFDNPAHLAPGAAENCHNASLPGELRINDGSDSLAMPDAANALGGPLEKVLRLASRLLDAPGAVINLTHENGVWYQFCFGTDEKKASVRDRNKDFFPLFAAQADSAKKTAKADICRLDEPIILGGISLKFYVSVPLAAENGYKIGTLYVLCSESRELDDFEISTLMDIAAIAVDEIELHLSGQHNWQGDALNPCKLTGKTLLKVRDPEQQTAFFNCPEEIEERYLSLIGLLSDWHWEQDENGRFTLIAETGQTRTPVQFRQYIGKTFREIPGMRMTEKEWRALENTLVRRRSFQETIFQWQDANNAVHYLSVSGQPILGPEGRFKGYRGVTKDVTEKIRFQEELARSNASLRELSEAQQAFREAERKRIARELHEELAQLLATSRMELCLLQRDLKPASPNHHMRLDTVDRMIGSSILSLRKLATDLRPSSLDEGGLYYALRSLLKTISENAGIECHLLASETDLAMDELQSTAIFRLVEECVTNIDRHAGAKKAMVQIYRSGNAMEIRVQDDGKGIRQDEIHKTKAFGLMEMRERVRKMKGKIDIKGSPGKGTHIAISLPHFISA